MKAAIKDYIIRNVLGQEGLRGLLLSDDEPLYSGGHITAAAHRQFVRFLEDEFRVSIDQRQLGIANFDTVERIADFVSNVCNVTSMSTRQETYFRHAS